MMRAATLTINPALDTSTSVDHVVVDRKLRCSIPAHDPGGGGINVARVLGTLGTEAVAVYPAGGPMGEMLTGLLAAEGLNQLPVEIAGWTRENFTVREIVTNQQYQFTMPGPALSREEQDRCLEALTGPDDPPDYVVISGSLPPGVPADFYARVVRRGHQEGFKVVVDTSGDPLRLAAQEGAHVLKPNLPELESLVGRELHTESDQEAAAREVLAHGPIEAVVASLGAGGALLATRENTVRFRAPTVRVQSRVGAGDSMVGGIVHGLIAGYSMVDATRLGVAAGSATVMLPGTQLCRREDVDRLFARLTPVRSA
jgi:6-phosphofructokinase 2